MRNAILIMVSLLCIGCEPLKTGSDNKTNFTEPKYKYTVLSMGQSDRSYDKTYLTNSCTYHHYGVSFTDSNGKEVFVSGNIRIEEQ